MIRQGEYGVLDGKEFEVFYHDGNYHLRSRDRQDTALGFSPVIDIYTRILQFSARVPQISERPCLFYERKPRPHF
ncbi:hypothetical protein F9802_07445 [Bacillus aerolatus]|uniref:Uncharacterized protein n=1 Tax=Bacillus aerolatus TaxID=2653354 RepID=A0A6I1FMT5_9BACI|nr:hypothetical protein [Bacillus aerolatus]KAB7707571.1 hypothetical protein F9802_07445 [Bacillus aerolatus]